METKRTAMTGQRFISGSVSASRGASLDFADAHLGRVLRGDASRSEARGSQGLSGSLLGRGSASGSTERSKLDREPSLSTCGRIAELYGWPQTFASSSG